MEHAAARNGLWLGHHLLAPAGAVATGWRLEALAPGIAERVAATGPDQSGARHGRQCVAPRVARGKKTGPNPTDRRKAGSKHHVLTDAHGIPLVARLTAAHRHDVTQLLPLVDAMPPLQGRGRPPGPQAATRPGRPWLRFATASQPLLARGIASQLAKRGRPHRQWLRPHALGRRAHHRLAASFSPIGRAVRTPALRSRGVSRVRMLTGLLVLPETGYLISQRALRTGATVTSELRILNFSILNSQFSVLNSKF